MTDGLLAAQRMPVKTALKVGKLALQDELGSRLGRKPKYIAAAGKPGDVAIMSAEDTLPGFESLTPPDSQWVNAVAARIGLWVGTYRPGRHAAVDHVPDPDLRLREGLARVRRRRGEGRG